MNPAPLRAVVDASVAVKLFVPEALSVQAQTVFARFAAENGAELIVPDLFFIECANVFWKWVQRSAYSGKNAQEHLHDLATLGLTAIPTQILAHDALGIALTHKITAYDACYLAAASQLKLPLITADAKLATKVTKGSCEVMWLGDIEVAARR
ncbi:MAG TPA: type II toxin-antitoxin system VapC family toxin [Candidatus Methylomirabilis sp.]|nr:type II toxin-antitoxin system VapC family toxin [Candidatus Methylomirabilis sp.]